MIHDQEEQLDENKPEVVYDAGGGNVNTENSQFFPPAQSPITIQEQ